MYDDFHKISITKNVLVFIYHKKRNIYSYLRANAIFFVYVQRKLNLSWIAYKLQSNSLEI